MAIAIQRGSVSYELISEAQQWVLAVPGPSLVYETLFCGVNSLRKVDKVKSLGLELCPSVRVKVPGIKKAIANIELERVKCIEAGDHILAIGAVLRFGINPKRKELPLLSIGPHVAGYRLLAKKGIHRIGIVADGS